MKRSDSNTFSVQNDEQMSVPNEIWQDIFLKAQQNAVKESEMKEQNEQIEGEITVESSEDESDESQRKKSVLELEFQRFIFIKYY